MEKINHFYAGFAALAMAGVFFFAACAQEPADSSRPETYRQDAGIIKVVASFYPLGEFAGRAGGENVVVTTVIPGATEPHDFEPTPQDIARISEADLFIYNGAMLDPWADKAVASLPKGVAAINMAEKLGIESDDPHFWLDPVIAQKEVEAIRDALMEADPGRADSYRQNAAAYIEKLQALNAKFASALSSCALKEIVTSHSAFAYLAKRYGFVQTSIAGFSPEAEPSARQLADLADEIKAKHIKYVFFETLVSPRLSETLAEAAGAKTLVLNPLEGLTKREVESGKDYISVMEENLSNLSLALECR